MDCSLHPGGKGEPDRCTALAIRAWNLLGGMEWSGIPFVAELLGYDEPDLLVMQLEAIRNRQSRDRG